LQKYVVKAYLLQGLHAGNAGKMIMTVFRPALRNLKGISSGNAPRQVAMLRNRPAQRLVQEGKAVREGAETFHVHVATIDFGCQPPGA
jgi:hypothetical protein